ncbi:MAG: AAA domain-containing protein [Acidobacteriota bacterium]
MTLRIDATGLADYVRLGSCERNLWYRLHPDETKAIVEDYGVEIPGISPLLAQKGFEHERDVIAAFEAQRGHEVRDLTGMAVEVTLAALAERGSRPLLLAQASVRGLLAPHVEGRGIADLIEIRRDPDDRVRLAIMDMKRSRSDKVEHRLQVAFYAVLLRGMARDAGVALSELTGAILRPGVEPSRFELPPWEECIAILATGAVRRVGAASREEATYHLAPRCDGCRMSAVCFREAAITRSLSLVPFLTLPEMHALQAAGVRTVDELAELKVLDPAARSLSISPGKEAIVEAVASSWPVAANIDLHVQRARAASKRLGGDVAALPRLLDAPFGTLPSREAHPDLVQVFLDVQYDYVEDRLWALAAEVVGRASTSVAHVASVGGIASGTAASEVEGGLLGRFADELMPAIHRAAGSDFPTLHVYLYGRVDLRRLCEGLERHLERGGGIAPLFELLTQAPALGQTMVSLLGAEVRERLNLGSLGHGLVPVASALGFSWGDLAATFSEGTFDGAGTLPDGRSYERAARFSSDLPLLYAYGAWGKLPPSEASGPYGRATLPDLQRFVAARARALVHVESSFAVKNRSIEKRPVPLGRLVRESQERAARPRRLADRLAVFLHYEHHAHLEETLAYLARPLDRRVASGKTLLARSLRDAESGRASFRLDFESLELDPAVGIAALSVRENDWMVVSEAENTHPWDIARGRLAIVHSLEGDALTVELVDMTFPRARFRYPHRNAMAIQRGRRYALDPMLDDIGGERLLDACEHAADNVLVALMEAGGGAVAPRPASPAGADAVVSFVGNCAARLAQPLTARQRDVITRLSDRVLLVHGPPGTGKTWTVAWAILARLWAAASAGRRLRVLVTAMTHTAVDVLLATIVRCRDILGEGGSPIVPLVLYREATEADTAIPAGTALLTRSRIVQALQTPLAVIGSVPTGVHRLLKAAGDGSVPWSRKHFDLVVIDEASQVSLPGAVLAGASLKQNGQVIVVGDHRQMEPILAHDWASDPAHGEEGVEASTFAYLHRLGFPTIALDESFRLHALNADFLDRHVYREDRVGLHSKRDEVLPDLPAGADVHPLARAALRPDVPMVVIEHDEGASLRHNPTENAIVLPLVAALTEHLRLDGKDGIGLVVPFRAQRAQLAAAHPDLAAAGAIHTVERFQGGERDVIVVSATASDPDYLIADGSFLYNPNRFTVAISRPRKKLIVVASSNVFRVMPPELEEFEDALLWKNLRRELSEETLWEGEVAGARVRVLGKRALS